MNWLFVRQKVHEHFFGRKATKKIINYDADMILIWNIFERDESMSSCSDWLALKMLHSC